MNKIIKKILKSTPLFDLIINIRAKEEIKRWKDNGKPIPPPSAFKYEIIKEYAKKFKIRTLIETGTYLGGTIWATRRNFKKIYSIEVDKDLYEKAKKDFKEYEHVRIIQGDSGNVISDILKEIKEPCLFWLDGHYSEGITSKGELNTPILKELEHILNHEIKEHVILIDDARCFNGDGDYPTMNELTSHIGKFGNYNIKDTNDIISITLK